MRLKLDARRTGVGFTLYVGRRAVIVRASFDGRFADTAGIFPWFGRKVTRLRSTRFVYRWVPFFCLVTARYTPHDP